MRLGLASIDLRTCGPAGPSPIDPRARRRARGPWGEGIPAGLALAITVLASRPAFADNPRDLFGLGKPGKPPPPPTDACAVPDAFGCALPPDPLDDPSPTRLTTRLTRPYLMRLPVAVATHDQIAHWALGAARDDAGVVIGGATGLENRWTLDGMAIDSIRTGATDLRIPVVFLDQSTIAIGGFAAGDSTSTGGTVDARLRGGTAGGREVDVHAWAGWSSAAPDVPIAPLTYQTRRRSLDVGPSTAAAIVATGPLPIPRVTAYYAVGLAPTLSWNVVSTRTDRLVDRDGDGRPDIVAGQAVLEPISQDERHVLGTFVPGMVRLGLTRGPHAVDVTTVANFRLGQRTIGNATELAAHVDRRELATASLATWRGRWRHTRAVLQVGAFTSNRDERPTSSDAGGVQRLTAFVPSDLAEDPTLSAACHDPTLSLVPACPVPSGYFASNGAGDLVDVEAVRTHARTDLAHRLGAHVVRIGGRFEDARLVTRSRFTGGAQVRELGVASYVETTRFVVGECGDTPGSECAYASESRMRYRTRHAAAYVQDTFSPTATVRVDGGLRWELMWVGPQLQLSNQLAPRLGIAWDALAGVLGRGRSKVWTSMGRSYAVMPAGLGPTIIQRDATARDVESDVGVRRTLDPGAPIPVRSGTRGTAQDEVTAGFEASLAGVLRVLAWAQGRWLRRGLETTASGFGNPGTVEGEPPARRDTHLLGFEIATSPTARDVLRAGYVVGRTTGNFPGPFEPTEGTTLYAGSGWNTDSVSSNASGPLPTSRGHQLFFEGDRRFKVRKVELGIATRLSLHTGSPRSWFAATSEGDILLLPRGSGGSGPLVTAANVRARARWRGVETTLDVFNVFDRAAATSVGQRYTASEVRAIEGGEASDLPFLKTTGGTTAQRTTSFGSARTFQAPWSVVVGVSSAF